MASTSTPSTTVATTTAATASTSSRCHRPPRVAVLGAGAAGLASARVLQRAGFETTVLEKDGFLGGVWNYLPHASTTTTPDRPMYRGLRTNLPKEIMAYREFPWTTTDTTKKTPTTPSSPAETNDSTSSSFVTHQDVLRYLHAYRDAFQLQVQLKSHVYHLKALTKEKSCFSPPKTADEEEEEEEEWPKFQLQWTQRKNDEQESLSMAAGKQQQKPEEEEETYQEDVFDAVCVANGHYGVPRTPEIPGLAEYFRGTTHHSVQYDDPALYRNQTVLCVGGRASGSDLAREMAQYAQHVYLSDAGQTTGTVQTLDNISWVPRTVAILPSGAVQFDHECPLQPTVDVIVFCTGYDYQFPFVNDVTSNIDVQANNRRVQPLWEQLWHAQYPNLIFVGLPHSVVPFPLFEFQVEAAVTSWKQQQQQQQQLPKQPKAWSEDNDDNDNSNNNNAVVLPPRAQRLQEAHDAAASGGKSKPQGQGRVPEDAHFLGDAQWDYCRRMAKYAGVYNEDVETYLRINQAIYEHTTGHRKGTFPAGPDHYREMCYERLPDKRSFRWWWREGKGSQ